MKMFKILIPIVAITNGFPGSQFGNLRAVGNSRNQAISSLKLTASKIIQTTWKYQPDLHHVPQVQVRSQPKGERFKPKKICNLLVLEN